MLQRASCASQSPGKPRPSVCTPPRPAASPRAIITPPRIHAQKHTRTSWKWAAVEHRDQPWDSSSSSGLHFHSFCPVVLVFKTGIKLASFSAECRAMLLFSCPPSPALAHLRSLSAPNGQIVQPLAVNMWSLQGLKYPSKQHADGSLHWLPLYFLTLQPFSNDWSGDGTPRINRPNMLGPWVTATGAEQRQKQGQPSGMQLTQNTCTHTHTLVFISYQDLGSYICPMHVINTLLIKRAFIVLEVGYLTESFYLVHRIIVSNSSPINHVKTIKTFTWFKWVVMITYDLFLLRSYEQPSF